MTKDKFWDDWLAKDSMVCPVCAAGIFSAGFTNDATAKLAHRAHHAQLERVTWAVDLLSQASYWLKIPKRWFR